MYAIRSYYAQRRGVYRLVSSLYCRQGEALPGVSARNLVITSYSIHYTKLYEEQQRDEESFRKAPVEAESEEHDTGEDQRREVV